eukprot:7878325-Karenia_brevis.AAC.1
MALSEMWKEDRMKCPDNSRFPVTCASSSSERIKECLSIYETNVQLGKKPMSTPLLLEDFLAAYCIAVTKDIHLHHHEGQ